MTNGEWPKMRLDECTEIVAGATPSTSVEAYWGGDVCWATPKDLSDLQGAYIADTPRKLTRAGLENCAATVLPAGSVLFSSRAPIGHTAVNTVPMATNQGFKSFIPKAERVIAKFLYWWLRTNRPYLESLGNGATFKEVSKTTVSRIEIPLPPLAEQRRIAEVLDRAEALRAKRRAALAQLDSLTQSLFLDLFGDPTSNPKGWPSGTLGGVATFVGGGTPSRARPEFYEGSFCWATSKDMKCEFLDDTQEHITEQAIEQSATNLVPPGTILIVVKSKILAHSLPLAIARVPTCFGQDLKGIKVSELCDVAFVTAALRLGKRWLLERARGINTEGLTLDHLRAFPLPLPPISLQREFARRVSAVERLKAAQRASLAELDALFASLQHRAFLGEL